LDTTCTEDTSEGQEGVATSLNNVAGGLALMQQCEDIADAVWI